MRWRLDTSSAPAAGAPQLDEEQRRVVDHRAGPLLVLAGPGTGKTTTIVEAVAARLSDSVDPLRPDQVLALTFGRKAALELRDRITGRLGGGVLPTVATFHAFAYALLRATAEADDYLHPPRLMSGAEEDVRIRELLKGAVADGTVVWPDDLAGALPTLGLATEVRAVLARARELEMDGDELERIGRDSGRPAWTAVGQLARQEQEVMALENVLDYGELLGAAVDRAHEPAVRGRLQRQYRAIYVDEYQDTDPLQVELLRALVGPQTAIVAVGDPDQSIYAFRGADLGGILRFRDEFAVRPGEPAPIVVLQRTRRFGPEIRRAATAALGRRVHPGIPAELVHAHRNPDCAAPDAGDVVTVRLSADAGVQAASVARDLRLAHLERGVPWQELAVLVRSANQIPALQRALTAAGVPVVVAADEIPLRAEPAVAALLAALDVATRPERADAAAVLDVLAGPLTELTASDLRKMGRGLRAAHHREGFAPPPSDDLLRSLLLAPLLRMDTSRAAEVEDDLPLLDPQDPATVAIDRLRRLLVEVRQQIDAGDLPEQVLWTLWSGGRTPHGWPQRLRTAALHGSRTADHDLDAVMALFDAAERIAGRYQGLVGVQLFVDSLAGQQIPAEPVAERGTRADAVRILTAHRSKGLEWDEVWIVGAQEGVWPDLRARGSTLRAEELEVDGVGSGVRPADLLEEERRLFYVACTRARARLHIETVDTGDDDEDGTERRSRFVDDVCAVLPAERLSTVATRPAHHVSLDGLVAELRKVAGDPRSTPSLREAAIARLAVLAAERDADGEALVPLAHPDSWWGYRAPTENENPVRDPDRPVALSGSSLDSILSCPLKWFLEHDVHAEVERGTATAFGSIVHAVADFVAKGEVPAELDAMDAEVDRVWRDLRFEARWQSEAERAHARAALARFLGYHVRADRELIGTEERVSTTVPVTFPDGRVEEVRISGFIDRIERDAQGCYVPIDLKNMKNAVPDKEIPEHGQLGLYQLLLRAGGLHDAEGNPTPLEVGGAALVQLRVDAGKAPGDPKVQTQDALPAAEPTWVEIRLGEAAQVLRDEGFDAVRGRSCTFCKYKTVCPSWEQGEQVVR